MKLNKKQQENNILKQKFIHKKQKNNKEGSK